MIWGFTRTRCVPIGSAQPRYTGSVNGVAMKRVKPKKSRNGLAGPIDWSSLFGAPPLLDGEDRALYDELLARVTAALAPEDITEGFVARDVADLNWELQRLRRINVALFGMHQRQHLVRALENAGESEAYEDAGLDDDDEDDEELNDSSEYGELVRDWSKRDPKAVKKVEGLLSSVGLSIDAMAARALSDNIEVFEQIDRMIARKEARRNAMLHEFERRRADRGSKLRKSRPQIEDGEYRVVDEGSARRRSP
jgi:hypothetical protein